MVAPFALIFVIQWMLLITQLCVGMHCRDSVNGSAIENFSCVIYNVSLMNCTWQASRDAPGDAQYFLYWKRYGDSVECELYIKDENGRNTGCRFQNVRAGYEHTYFLVNGSSKDSLIHCEKYIQLFKIEKLMPPSNIAVKCDENKDHCLIKWQQPQRSNSEKDKCYKYQIIIKYTDNPEGKTIYNSTEEGRTNHTFPRFNKNKKHFLKMRAAGTYCTVNTAWGEWSPTVEFGNEVIISFEVWILIVVASVTVLVTIATVLICKRTGFWKKAFPQVPDPKKAFCRLPDTNPELMENKIEPIASENEDVILVADILK